MHFTILECFMDIVIEQIHFTIWDGWRIMYYGWMDA